MKNVLYNKDSTVLWNFCYTCVWAETQFKIHTVSHRSKLIDHGKNPRCYSKCDR